MGLFFNKNQNQNSNETNSKEEKNGEEIIIQNMSQNDFLFYLNVIGGHSLFIIYSSKYLIKSSNPKEIELYKMIKENNLESDFLPKYYGTIESKDEQYKYIIDYIRQCEIFFKKMLIKLDIKLEDINKDNDEKFKQKYTEFLNNKDIDDKEVILNKSFEILESQLIEMFKKCKKHFYWTFYYFIKWKTEFYKEKYIIIENFEYNILVPSILDIKLGTEKKMSKKTGTVKSFMGATKKFGCRIMGIYSTNNYFKNRYETRDLNEEEFNIELMNFTNNQKETNSLIVKEINDIISYVASNIKYKIDFASLLIILDSSNGSKKLRVGLIDLNINETKFKEEKTEIQNRQQSNEDIIKCIKNLINIFEGIK